MLDKYNSRCIGKVILKIIFGVDMILIKNEQLIISGEEI